VGRLHITFILSICIPTLTFRLSAEALGIGAGDAGLLFLTYLAAPFPATLSGTFSTGGGLPGMAFGVLLVIIGCLIDPYQATCG